MSNLDTLDGERGVPGVNAPRSRARWLRGLVFGALVLSGPVIGLAWYFRSTQTPPPAAAQKALPASSVPARTFTLAALPTPAPPVAPPAAPPPTAAPSTPAPPPASLPAGPAPPRSAPAASAPPPRPKRTLNKSAGPLMIPNGSSPAAANAASPDGKRDSDLGALLTATHTPPRAASVLQDRDYLLPKGTFIDCALETKLVSTVPGLTSCRVTRSIYSDTGRVVLVDRGSTVSGEYNATMRQGQARIFVLWTRIKTPSGVVVSLDSPATDQLGAGGIPGYVDTHFWQRFGGALLLSLVDDAAGAAVAATQRDGQIVNFGGTSDATSSAVAEALRNTINIPPTLYTNQGARVGIYVARDLSFRAVYDLQPSGFSNGYAE